MCMIRRNHKADDILNNGFVPNRTVRTRCCKSDFAEEVRDEAHAICTAIEKGDYEHAKALCGVLIDHADNTMAEASYDR